MSVTSKECFVAAILMVADQSEYIFIDLYINKSNLSYARYLPSAVSGDLLYLVIVSVFLAVKLSFILAEPIDPFSPMEGIVATVAFGGLWDSSDEMEEKTE